MHLFVRLLAVLIGTVFAAPGEQTLPVFLADNHAETAGWITRRFDLDAPHYLVLVDAHSDASAAERSDDLREELRRVTSFEQRAERIEQWRANGRLQAFNWIEPLLPRPLEQVLWLAAPRLSKKTLEQFTHEAGAALDGRLEVEPRSAGSFAGRWQTTDLAGFCEWQPGRRKVILAIDLDFFAGMPAPQREAHFATIWERAMDWPGLVGVAFAVSRPWLIDDQEADALVSLAIDAVHHTRGASLEIDASMDDRPDDSLKATELAGKIPRWDFAAVSPEVRVKLAELGVRLSLMDRRRTWDGWQESNANHRARLVPENGQPDADEVWRYRLGDEPIVRVVAPHGATGRTRWFLKEAVRSAYDLLPETGLGKGFATAPARWIYEKPRLIGETNDFLLDPSGWRQSFGGRFLIVAECETTEGWLSTSTLELRVRTAEGFRGSLSECLGMPYVFGISGVRSGNLSGVESGWGSDCANLLVHAWRRNGAPLLWGDPGRLRTQLATLAADCRIDSQVPISATAIECGIAIDFDTHVAALWQDEEPLGTLDGSDWVMHHLGGVPEIVRLADLAATRRRFSVCAPITHPSCQVKFAGDVVLAGADVVAVEGFEKGEADLLLINLEGIPSLQAPATEPRYDFRFPPERLATLQARGVGAVSLANNHAADAGEAGLLEGIAALEKAELAVCGAGNNAAEACRPLRIDRQGVRLAVFGVSCFKIGAAGPERPGIAALPIHRDLLEKEFHAARMRGESIVVMVHWGDEYDARVSDEQRHWARWLVARGAQTIVGSGPHVTQRDEFHGGATIVYSLGNALYPRALKGADSGMIRELAVF